MGETTPRRENLLLVDDELAIPLRLKERLSQRGLGCRIAASGSEALELKLGGAPDLRGNETAGHSRRVTVCCPEIAKR